MRRACAFSVAIVLGLGLFIGLAGPTCVSCCPTPEGKGPALSSLGCCGEGCAERLASGQDRPCLTSARVAAAKSPVVAVSVAAAPVLLFSESEVFLRRPLWLPASARPGTRPLRL